MNQSVSDTRLPRVRTDLEFIPIQYEQRQLILVRDQLGLVAEGQALPEHTFRLLQVLDSTRDAVALREAMMQMTQGPLITQAEVLAFVNELDGAYLLQSHRFAEAYADLVNTFSAESVRPCALCGRAYPQDTNELTSWLENILANPAPQDSPPAPPKAIVAPHIDPPVGASVYASAYAQLKGLSPERVIILGVGHQLAESLFCLTDKAFATPLGTVQADSAAVAKIRAAGMHSPGSIAVSDFSHRSEHSIEFQMLFLQHLLPQGSFSIVPILCGSPQLHLEEYSRPAFVRRCRPVLDALSSLAQDKNTLVIAGVDLSHIGLKFGHKQTARELENETTAHDGSLLDCLVQGDATGFWEQSARVQDKYNVCGFSALATLQEILPGATGQRLDYAIWHEEPTQSGVSFAAMTFS